MNDFSSKKNKPLPSRPDENDNGFTNQSEYVNDFSPTKSKPLPPIPDDAYLETSKTFKFRAKYTFDASGPEYSDEFLSIVEGDELIGSSSDLSADWIEVQKGRDVGQVPASYIELCQ